MNALSISLAGGILATTYLLKSIRWVRVHGFWSSIYWTIRSWLWDYPITQDYAVWNTGDPNDLDVFERDRRRLLRMWLFLRPFFASCGYHLYSPKDSADIYSDLVPTTPKSTGKHSFPYAPCLYKTDEEARYSFYSPFVWPARDRMGRDVMIKAVSGLRPTNELQALRLLNSDVLRDDPRNHTTPVLEFLEFNSQVFVVMPRWTKAIKADFVTVGELVRYGQAFFEAIAFLHEHKIAHGDILLQNMLMDAMVSEPEAPFGTVFAGVRGPERKYAFIDFETATLPALSSDSSSPDGEHLKQPHPPAPEFASASKSDVGRLASTLEINLRCIEDVMPDLGTLFDSMKDCDDPHHPTAAAALSRYKEICGLLGTDDMHREVKAIRWRHGRFEYRVSPPMYTSDS